MLSRVRKLALAVVILAMLFSSITPGLISPVGHINAGKSSSVSHSSSVSSAVSSNLVYTPVVGKPGNITSTLFPLNNTIVPGAQLPPSTLSTNPFTANIVYDPVNQIAYAVNYGSDNITLVNVTTHKLEGAITNISSPFAALYDPVNGFIYVAAYPNITVIDTSTNKVIKNITCGQLSTSGTQSTISTLALDSMNNTIFVANTNSHNVSVISGTTNTVVNNFNFHSSSAAPNGVAYDSSNNTVYVVDPGLSLVYVLNATNYVQITNFSLPSSTDGGSIFYDPSSNSILIGSMNYFTLLEINPAKNNSMNAVSTNGYPYDMVYDPTNNTMLIGLTSQNSILVLNSSNSIVGNITRYGNSLCMAYTGNVTQLLVIGENDASAISIMNASTGTILKTFIFYIVPTMTAYDSNNGYVYLTDSNSNIIYVINPLTNSTVGLIQTPEKPGAIVYDSGNGMLFTGGNFYITEINPSTESVVQTLYLGYGIVSMAYDPTNGYIYTSNFYMHSVTAYDPVSNSIVMTDTLPLFAPSGGMTQLEGLSYDPADQLIYVNGFNAQEVYVLPASTLSGYNVIGIGTYPTSSAYDPLGQSVYVGSIAGASISVLKGYYFAGSIPSLGGGGGIAFNAKNNLMYVASTTLINGVTYLYAVNAYTGTVVGEIPANNFVTDPVYAPSSKTMYAPDGTGDGVYLISGFAPTNYTIYFNETGLPSGTWYVNVSTGAHLSGTSSSLSFAVPNGTYYYTVQAANKLYGAASGEFNVTGSNKTVDITFSSTTYSVTFNQTGLPSGDTWWLNLSDGTSLSSSNGTITASLVAGTYSYNISSDNKSWNPVPSSGNFNVNNTAVTVNVTFSEVTYQTTFAPFSLPLGDIMYVNLSNGMNINSTSTYSVTVNLPNGTYTYVAYSNDTRYSARPYTGTVTVNGASQYVPIFFGEIFYNVTFTETGLPSGTTWYVNSTGQFNSGPLTGSTYSVNLTNGTYSYVATCNNASLKASGGTFTVSGYQYNVSVQFSNKKYSVNFTESNLPSGTAWYVNLTTGLSLESTSATITTSLNAGTYTYTVSTSNKSYTGHGGTINVGGTNNNFSVVFTPVTYNVTFDETGLPSGTAWYVNSSSTASGPITTSSYSLFMINGSYTFTIVTGDGNYVSQSPVVHVNVTGSKITKSVTFTSTHNTVTFNGSGFVPGSTWYVNISNGQKFSTTTNTITVSLAAGSYTFTVASGNKTVRPVPPSGTLTVAGSNISVNIAFYVVNYKVTFTETGLPGGTLWTVYLNDGNFFNPPGQPVYLTNGTYHYTIKSNNSNYVTPGGSFTVNGKNITVAVVFTKAAYTVTFKETGLPSGTSWSVDFNGTLHSSTTSTITFSVNNGNYSYTVESVKNYYLSGNPNGSLSVSGLNNTVTEAFLHYSYISLKINPANSIVYVNGVRENTPLGTLNLTVKGGTYDIKVTDTGYQTYYKNFTLNPGQTENLTITLKTPGSPGSSTFLPLNTYEILGIVAVVVIAIGAAVAIRRRR